MTEYVDTLADHVTRLAAQTPAAGLYPWRYFVAGSGVITLGFRGFTQGLMDLKQRLAPGLRPEDPGSLWPKITLAALEADEPLSPDEIQQLVGATSRADSLLAAEPLCVHVDSLSVVSFRNRALTGQGLRINIALAPALETAIPPGHHEYVRRVLAQWGPDLSPAYMARIRAAGHRRSHYEVPCDGSVTLAAFVPQDLPGLADLRDHIERALPGRYHWFPLEGRHVTVRSLRAETEIQTANAAESRSETMA